MVNIETAGSLVPLEGCSCALRARTFTTKCKVEAARQEIDSGRAIARTARLRTHRRRSSKSVSITAAPHNGRDRDLV